MKRRVTGGFSVLELLVGITISLSLFAGLLSTFLNTTRRGYDNETVNRADEQARTILDFIAFDLRMAGAGMPLGQSSFAIGDAALGDAPLPVLLSASNDFVQFRVNELGRDAMLTANYAPSSTNLTFGVSSVVPFAVGDTIYMSSMPVGATSGLRGTVSAVGASTLTIQPDYVATAGGVFEAGSVVAPVRLLTYQSTADWAGIIRDNGVEESLVAFNSIMSLSYRNAAGTEIVLPLTEAAVRDNLTSVQLTISVRGERRLASGNEYIATAEQRIMLRNLMLSR